MNGVEEKAGESEDSTNPKDKVRYKEYDFHDWEQFQAAAKSLKGYSTYCFHCFIVYSFSLFRYAKFYVATSSSLYKMFDVKGKDLPMIIMRSNIRHPHPTDYFNPRPLGEEYDDTDEEDFLVSDDKTHFYYQFPKEEYKSSRIYDSAVVDWVLKLSTLSHSNSFRELTVSSSKSEIYSNQFLSLKKMKFLLLLKASTSSMIDEDNYSHYEQVIHNWRLVGNRYDLTGDVLFSYLFYSNSPQHRHRNHPILPTIIDTYDIDIENDLPLVIAFNAWNNRKFRSKNRISLKVDLEEETRKDLEDSDDELSEEDERNDLFSFVQNVMTGNEGIFIKSELIPKNSLEEGGGYVRKIVGKTLLSTVGQSDIDVLLLIYAPLDYESRNFLSIFDLLGRAVQHEERFLIGKINGLSNDIPSVWNIKTYPTLLWFPAKDKRSDKRNHRIGLEATPLPLHHLNPFTIAAAREESGETKRNPGFPSSQQTDGNGISLYELYLFLQRETSFPVETLRIATVEQIGSLLSDEDEVKKKYELFERNLLRNEGRKFYENEWIDWFVGEVAFDGKLYHLMIGGLLTVSWVILLGYLLLKWIFSDSSIPVVKKKAHSSLDKEGASESSEEGSLEEDGSTKEDDNDSLENVDEEESEKEVFEEGEVVGSLPEVS
jgi:hypothetical protein